jgi:sodium/bile acid cotransporter 7
MRYNDVEPFRPTTSRLLRAFLKRHGFLVLMLAALAATFAMPRALETATRHVEPRLTVAASLFLMALTLPTRSLLGEFARPAAALWAVLVSYGFAPAAAWLAGQLTTSPDLRVGLQLAGCVPCTLASAVLWTRLAHGNEATALLAVLGTTVSSWLATTLWLHATTSADVTLDFADMIRDLVVSLVLPVGAGQLARVARRLATFADRRKPLFGAIAQGFVLANVLKAGVAVGFVLHAGEARLTAGWLALSIVLPIGLHFLTLLAGYFSGGWLGFDRPRRIAVAFSCSQKTLPVSLLLFQRYYQTLFPLAILPLLFHHVGQLLLDTVIAARWREQEPKT